MGDDSRFEDKANGAGATRTAIVNNRRGLHARAAAKFVTISERFGSVTEVCMDDQVVSASSIMGLMMLGAAKGAVLTFRADGDDAQAAVDALAELVEAGFGEID